MNEPMTGPPEALRKTLKEAADKYTDDAPRILQKLAPKATVGDMGYFSGSLISTLLASSYSLIRDRAGRESADAWLSAVGVETTEGLEKCGIHAEVRIELEERPVAE